MYQHNHKNLCPEDYIRHTSLDKSLYTPTFIVFFFKLVINFVICISQSLKIAK